MEDLVLIKKATKSEILKGARTGRPARENFALRNYKGACVIAIPPILYTEGDKVDFYLSSTGFAVKLDAEGTRAVSGKKSTRTASVPKEVRDVMQDVAEGSCGLIAEDRGDRLWFFPFSQFAAV